MTVFTKELRIKTDAYVGIHDITENVQVLLEETHMRDGIAVVFCQGSTGAITTMEYEPGLIQDMPEALERVAPKAGEYAHHKTWGDDNGSGHVRASLVGPSLAVPFVSGRLMLGRWQHIVFLECDSRSRDRRLVIQIIGESNTAP